MGAINVDSGTPLPLIATLPDGATNQFPLAYVSDIASVPLVGSPFALTHVGMGVYNNLSVIPSLNGIYNAVYVIYSDSSHIVENLTYERGSDTFSVRPAPVNIPAPDLDPSSLCTLYGFIDDILSTASTGAQLIVSNSDPFDYGSFLIRPSSKVSVANGSGMVQLVLIETTSISKKYKFQIQYTDDLTSLVKKKTLGYAKVPAQASANLVDLVFTSTP